MEHIAPDGRPYEDTDWVVKEEYGVKGIVRWDNPEPPVLMCSHVSNATMEVPDFEGKGKMKIRVCAMCDGLKSRMIANPQPNLEERTAQCPYCKICKPSSRKLPFFEHRLNHDFDSFYCGCRGWD